MKYNVCTVCVLYIVSFLGYNTSNLNMISVMTKVKVDWTPFTTTQFIETLIDDTVFLQSQKDPELLLKVGVLIL